jgi:hypothetical protein
MGGRGRFHCCCKLITSSERGLREDPWRLVSYVSATVNEGLVVDSFLTFVYVDEDGKPQPHHITIEPVTEEDRALYDQSKELN